ncbi:MAG: hypothetical protein KME29_17265 [Calothrix sp. FI2-JRJ7]|nr:hypothetical protein [Calothrix sp. FI2-JRJ7]
MVFFNCLLETLKFVDNDHNPNAIQLAILARLIELRPRYDDLGHLFDEKGLKLKRNYVLRLYGRYTKLGNYSPKR